jgi:NADH dehydrogenase
MPDAPTKTRILILGAGFGGTYCALRLDKTLARRDDCEVCLVDRDNFILFTPMLHEVAASDLDPADIVNPIRKLLQHVTFYEALVESIDLDAKSVEVSYGFPRKRRTLPYDQLVIGLGSSTKFFDEQTAQNAVEMKTLGDAMFLRNRMIGILESATVEDDPAERRRLLTFVVAGGGFAGVETIGAMNDFLRDALQYYPKLDPAMLRVILAHHGDVLLPEFSPKLGKYTEGKLRDAGIDVRLKTGVKTYDGRTVTLDQGDPVPAGTLLWTAGVTPDRIVAGLPLTKDKGRIVTDGCMRSVDRPEVWVVGDAAAVPDPYHPGKPYTSTAQTAIRQGPRLAKNIEAVVLKQGECRPFKYRLMGQLAAIGQRRGTAEIFGIRFSGFLAWFMWRTIYLSKLPRLEKKIRVGVSWALDLFFSRDLVQIFTLKDIQRVTAFGIRNQLGPTSQSSPAPGHSDSPPDGGDKPTAGGEHTPQPPGEPATLTAAT